MCGVGLRLGSGCPWELDIEELGDEEVLEGGLEEAKRSGCGRRRIRCARIEIEPYWRVLEGSRVC